MDPRRTAVRVWKQDGNLLVAGIFHGYSIAKKLLGRKGYLEVYNLLYIEHEKL